MFKGQLIFNILSAIKESGGDTADVFMAILKSGYGAPHGVIEKCYWEQKENKIKAKKLSEIKQRYYNLLYKLKEDGLVAARSRGNKKLSLTAEGLRRWGKLQIKSQTAMPDPENYRKENSASIVVVTFDIPERVRYKRYWLRSVLKNIGMNSVQQSVFLGKVKIPEALIEDLTRYHLLDKVEIFEVGKSGTLRQLA